MSRAPTPGTARRTRRARGTALALLAMAVLGIVALAGCGVGQHAQTGRQVPDIAGADSGDGPVVVRDARSCFEHADPVTLAVPLSSPPEPGPDAR